MGFSPKLTADLKNSKKIRCTAIGRPKFFAACAVNCGGRKFSLFGGLFGQNSAKVEPHPRATHVQLVKQDTQLTQRKIVNTVVTFGTVYQHRKLLSLPNSTCRRQESSSLARNRLLWFLLYWKFPHQSRDRQTCSQPCRTSNTMSFFGGSEHDIVPLFDHTFVLSKSSSFGSNGKEQVQFSLFLRSCCSGA